MNFLILDPSKKADDAMHLSLVLSIQSTQFQAVAHKGDFEQNVAKIASYGYDGVELAIRDPGQVDHDRLIASVSTHGLAVPPLGLDRHGERNICPLPIRIPE